MTERLIMGERRHGNEIEDEPIVVRNLGDGTVVLALDDGEEIRVDRTELLVAALEEPGG